MHTHTIHSFDGKDSMRDMCAAAIERGIRHICFTEHYDLNPRSRSYGHFSLDRFERDLDDCRDEFGSSLEILKGIEFAEPHRHQDEFRKMCRNDFDVVIGAIHWLGDAPAVALAATLSAEELFALYYQEILAAVRFGGFDVLAHLDLPKRWVGYSCDLAATTETIFHEMLDRDIALEINTSTCRTDIRECTPGLQLVQQWKSMGGSKIVVGSDAHSASSIGGGFEQAADLLGKVKLSSGLYRDRQYCPDAW